MAGFLAGSPLLRSQQDPFRDHSRVPGLNELVTAFDFEPVAYAKVPRYNYDYTAYGADSEFTLRRSREAFDWVQLLPNRVLEVGTIRTATEILGTPMDYPIMVSPSASHTMLHPDGELATYQGAVAASNTPYIVSNVSSFPFEKIAAAAKGPLWFQLYPKLELNDNRERLDRVQASGARAVVLTIDQQASEYERILHDRKLTTRTPAARRTPPENPYRVPENRLFYTWKLLEQIRGICKVPLLAKGILTAQDRKDWLGVRGAGVEGSNHGARAPTYS